MGRRKSDDYSKSFKSIKDIQDKGYELSEILLTETNADYLKRLIKNYRFLDFEDVLIFLADYPELMKFLVKFQPTIRKYFPTEDLIVFYYEDYELEICDLWISIMFDETDSEKLDKFKELEEELNKKADKHILSHISLTSTPP